jgi:hypothetical protein
MDAAKLESLARLLGVDDVEIPRRFELNFHGQTSRRLDGLTAAGDIAGTPVDAVRTARGQGRINGAVEFLGR